MTHPKHDPFSIRLPIGMRDRIRTNAEANRRSMNAEIVHYLDRALAGEPEAKGAASGATDPRHVTNQPL